MPIVLVHQGPTLTQERYEEAVRKLTGQQRGLQSPADWPVDGLLVHTAGQAGGGFRIVDVWASQAAAEQFGATLMPILEAVGITDLPEIYPAHTFVAA